MGALGRPAWQSSRDHGWDPRGARERHPPRARVRDAAQAAPEPSGEAGRRPEGELDEGLHLPLLAPSLCGVRARLNKSVLEFTLPNPSGGRGVYVAGWQVVSEYAQPVLHDTLLVSRLSGQAHLTPTLIRQAARQVALGGHAGSSAAEAARRARELDEVAMLRLRARLLRAVAHAAGFTRPEEAERCLGTSGFTLLAEAIGWQPPALAAALHRLSADFLTLVPAQGTEDGTRWSRLAHLLQRLRLSLTADPANRLGPQGLVLTRIVAACSDVLRRCERLRAELEADLADPLALLNAARDGRDSAAHARLAALEAACDGWDRIGLLWFDEPEPARRRALLPELAAIARVTVSSDGWSLPAASTPLGAGPASLARNERIRAQEELLVWPDHGPLAGSSFPVSGEPPPLRPIPWPAGG